MGLLTKSLSGTVSEKGTVPDHVNVVPGSPTILRMVPVAKSGQSPTVLG
jgi:hypothetical protein